MRILPIIAVVLGMNSSAFAQWVNVPLPKTPRLPDGKPNLTAPVPKTRDGKPDLSGIWRVADGKYLQNIASDGVQVPFQPWAEEVFKERQANFGKDNPSGRCLPHGVPDSFLVRATPFKIIQTPFVTVALLENQGHYRTRLRPGWDTRSESGKAIVLSSTRSVLMTRHS